MTRRNRMIAGAAAVLIGALGIAGLVCTTREHDEPAAPCEAERTAIQAEWSESHRTAITEALRATNVAFAGDTAARVSAALDTYVRGLESARSQLCKQPPPGALFEQGLACVGELRVELRLFREWLLRITAADARFAVMAVYELPSSDDCTNHKALQAKARETPQLETVRKQVTDAIRDTRTGKPVAGAEPLFRETAAIAETAHADELRALVLVRLAGVLAEIPGREGEALALEPVALAAIKRATHERVLVAELHRAMGTALTRSGATDKSLTRLEAALAAARAAFPAGDPRLPGYVHAVAVALNQQQRPADARPYQEEAHRLAVDAFGAEHPVTLALANELAQARRP
ncbi:MAG TPA: hypothetical protein VIV11_32665 [Kofleriaceae bacterium]